MKLQLLLLFLLCVVSMRVYSQSDNELTIDTVLIFSPEDFTIVCPNDTQGCLIQSDKFRGNLSNGGLVGEPVIPYLTVNIYHRNTLSFSTVQAFAQEQLFAEDFILMLNQAAEPNSAYGSPDLIRKKNENKDYHEDTYPANPVEFASEIFEASLSDKEHGYTILRVYPFRYDAKNLKLYLNEFIQVRIVYRINGLTAIQTLEDEAGDCTSSDNQYFDISGRRLNSTPIRRGVYIKDGRKVVVK